MRSKLTLPSLVSRWKPVLPALKVKASQSSLARGSQFWAQATLLAKVEVVQESYERRTVQGPSLLMQVVLTEQVCAEGRDTT